ncbi:hypothetical protein ACS0TY_027170 [Phlomoides rotata]
MTHILAAELHNSPIRCYVDPNIQLTRARSPPPPEHEATIAGHFLSYLLYPPHQDRTHPCAAAAAVFLQLGFKKYADQEGFRCGGGRHTGVASNRLAVTRCGLNLLMPVEMFKATPMVE